MKPLGFCSECGTTLTASANFCSRCGAAVPQPCARCGHYNNPKAHYCESCGIGLAGTSGPAAAPPPALQPSERKFVTIMFVDMIDSLAAIRDADPEEARELFSRVLGLMTDAVHSCAGTVVRTMGDGIMALFGAPSAQEDHAMRACHAALRVIDTIRKARSTIPRLNVRIGLHSGLVVVGRAENDLSFNYDATGVAVHIASRLQNAAQPGTIVMTSATRKLVQKETILRSLGLLKVKGLDDLIEGFELCGTHAGRPVLAAPSDEPFVGRASELAELVAALRSSLLGKGCFIAVVGEPGVGKTRFVERFLDLHAGPVATHVAKIERYNGITPFHPIRDLLISILGLASMDAEPRAARLHQRLEELGISNMGLEAPLADLLDAGSTPAEWRAIGPPTRGHMMASAALTLLLKESEDRPLILALEDLQRADSATTTVIGMLADAIGQHRILMLVTFRPEFAHSWSGKEAYRQVRLDRLNADEIDELTDRLIGTGATQALRKLLFRWSQGNPLFIHETVLALVEEGILGGEIGSRVLLAAPDNFEPPDTVASMIAERIDRLPAEPKTVLQAASVLGEQFPIDMLAHVMGKPADVLWGDLQALESSEFIRQVTLFPRPVFSFRHMLFQEVCYASLLKSRRRELHAAAFAALSASDSAGSPPVERFAYHSFRAALWEEALRYCRAAGQHAVYRSANREAVRHFENAMAALANADPDGNRLEDAIETALELRSAHIPLLQLVEAGEILAEVQRRATRLGDRRRLAQLTGFMAGHAYLTQNPRESVRLAEAALDLARELGDASLQVAPNIHLGQALHALGEFKQSVEVLNRNLAILAGLESRMRLGLPAHPLLMTWRWMALSLAELGAFDEALPLATGGIHAGDDLPQYSDELYSKATVGFVRLVRGDLEAARDISTEAMAIADQHDLPFMVPVVASQLGLIHAMLGDTAEGLRLARRAVDTAGKIGVSAGNARWHARLAECYLLAGAAEEAMTHARTALSIADEAGEQGYGCYALRLRGRIAAAMGVLDDARRDITEARARAHALSMAPLVAKCALDLAVLAHQTGDAAAMHDMFADAIEGFQRLKMDAWAARASEQMTALAPPARNGAPHSANFVARG